MFEKLLNEIRTGGTYEARTLAARLGTTPEIVVAMLEHLHQLGVVKPYQNCSEGCSACSLQSGCHPAGSSIKLRLWQI